MAQGTASGIGSPDAPPEEHVASKDAVREGPAGDANAAAAVEWLACAPSTSSDESAQKVTVGTLTTHHGTNYDLRVLRSSRRQE
ncbi:hypothetical protein IscW_ISCW022978 [Ixodes scapularis]|uniref:Uncharacterized protein n=1 Tax=Ixodes scapularis TaxID=6945 RepID=B7QKY3_IXOSC|nr:hypothetical protein IscW_ISCW022978 [Ixodes scapularis]|eukprot:XP_002415838.1 hypothetical protein IscW_ISCW022978 [Ixodes scapularis]